MTLRLPHLGILLLALSIEAPAAGLDRYKTWNKSPEFVCLATDAEVKEWKKVSTDEQAEKFIQLFWAKRDPKLETSINEFKVIFDQRVKEADQNFALPRMRGALTERGKLFLVLGPPKTLWRVAGTKPPPIGTSLSEIPTPNDPGTSIGEAIVTFVYEAPQLPDWVTIKDLKAEFVVEPTTDFAAGQSVSQVKRLELQARPALIKNPNLKEPPHVKTPEELEAEIKAAEAAAAEALKGPVLSPPVRTALEGILGKEETGSLGLLPIIAKNRETRLQFQLFVPASVGTLGPDSKLTVLARSEAGVDAARLEEVTGFDPTAGGSVASRVFAIPPGSYDVAAAVLDATGKLVYSARRKVSIGAPSADLSLSQLVVGSSFLPAPQAKADEAFVLNGHRFVLKGGRLDPEDGVLFLVRVYNPKVDPTTKSVKLSRKVSIKPKGKPAMDVPQGEDPPIAVPDSSDPSEIVLVDVGVAVIESNLGEYLRTAGDYDLKVSVTDQVAQKTIDTSATFTVTGVLPPKKK